MPFLRAIGYFHDSKFFACFVSTKSYVLLSDGAGDVTEYHVLRRQRSHVFLAHVLRSERTVTAVRSSAAYVLRSQGNRICIAMTTDVAICEKRSLPEDMTAAGDSG